MVPTDIAHEHTASFTAACLDNFTSLSLVIYVGDEFSIEDCGACKAPIEGSDADESFVFELSCVPECTPDSPPMLQQLYLLFLYQGHTSGDMKMLYAVPT
jgi:hypothetical protein